MGIFDWLKRDKNAWISTFEAVIDKAIEDLGYEKTQEEHWAIAESLSQASLVAASVAKTKKPGVSWAWSSTKQHLEQAINFLRANKQEKAKEKLEFIKGKGLRDQQGTLARLRLATSEK